MGFFSGLTKFVSNVFSNADDAARTLSNPSKMLALHEDLITPRDVSLDGFFRKADTVIDLVDYGHQEVQYETTGSYTQDGQSPYFQKLAPAIVNIFLPGVGSAMQAVDGVSQGDTKQAVIGAASAVASFYGPASSYGKVANVTLLGAKGYAIYDSANNLKGYIGEGSAPVNMVNQNQAQTGIALNTGTQGGAYNAMTHSGDTTNVAANMALAEVAQKKNDYLILAVGAIALYYMR